MAGASERVEPIRLESDEHIRGAELDAGARTLIQYGDYECPFCLRDELGLTRLLDQAGDSLRFVFRHFPIAAEHPNAERAALAAEAAARLGDFWGMHHQLMLRPAPLTDAAIAECGEAAGLAPEQLWSAIADPELPARVGRDLDSGRELGVGGTPWYLLDGHATGPLPRLAAKLRDPLS